MDLSRYNKPVNLSGPSNFFNNMSARATSTSQMVLQHGMNMEAAHHGNELAKDYATHVGGIHSALSAQEHGQTSALSAQEHGQRLKETAANNRHIIKKTVLDHNNDLEKRAVDHHLSTDKLRTESGLRVTEANTATKNTIRESKVAHKHAGELMDRIAASGQGGTQVDMAGSGIKAKFTLKIPSNPATNPTPTVAPSQPKKMIHVTPVTRAATPAPAAPKQQVLLANHPVTGALVRRDSLTSSELALADAKRNSKPSAAGKKAPAKKAAPAKGQPTVTRDPKTGRMIGIKKK